MNPLLSQSNLNFEAIDFSKIKVEHYLPALDETILKTKENYNKLKKASEINFDSIILAGETANDELDQVVEVFYALHSAHCTEDLENISEEFNQKLTELTSDISLDADIFSVIQKVYDKKDSLELTNEQLTVLENTYKGFTRNGALLNESDKNLLREIDQDLAQLTLKFSENSRKSSNEFLLEIIDEKDLKGIPDGVIEAAKECAKNKKSSATWAFSLDYPSYMPFMQYCQNRDLRKKMYEAKSTVANSGEYNNQGNIKKILELRMKRAKLLGFENHPSYVLDRRMAKKPAGVISFLDDLKVKSKTKAREDFEKLKSFKEKISGDKSFLPHDMAMYQELLRKEELDFDDEELRPYFKLDNVINGVFTTASKLYGIKFTECPELPVYHPDVTVYKVEDKEGEYLGLFYTDFFPREEKRAGAWMTTFRNAGFQFGEVKRPFISIVCNFTKPTASKPSLLTLNEVLTLFHEFGHGLHGLLAKSTYKSIAGTNVYWDFVELPSQIMENWVLEKECLDLFAKHYETGETMPVKLIEKVKKSETFLAGLATFRQLSLGYLDMNFHMSDPSDIDDVIKFENKSMEDFSFYESKPIGSMSCSFGHVFAGGYSAGYYSYKWAEVLDADAFSYFKEKGIFNQEVAKKFRENILEMGGSEDPMELYKRFRGSEPKIDALLERSGLA